MRRRNLFGLLPLLLLCALLLTTASSASFSDVPAGAWYAQAITEMEAAGLLSGYPDGRFGPGDPISAAQFVSVTARCAGLEPVRGQTSHLAAGRLQAALQAGWYDWDEIPPTGQTFDRPIPRQLAVKILMRALLPQARGDYNTESAKMRDFARLDGRYYEPVLAAYAAGIVNGDARGNFNPQGSLSRAEACILFQRALKLAKDGPRTPTGPAVPEDPPEVPKPVVTVSGGVSENGWLSVRGTQLCNEPNGNVTWERDVKPYAQALIPVIRAESPKAVILVGSPTWSQDIHLAARSPLRGENLMYTLHFYAGTHGADLRRRIDEAMSAGLPVFVSEWGTSRADGGGGVFLREAAEWLDFLARRGVSWANWSLCDKNETSAALRPGTSPHRAWTEADLTESGKFVFSRFRS